MTEAEIMQLGLEPVKDNTSTNVTEEVTGITEDGETLFFAGMTLCPLALYRASRQMSL